MFVWNVFFILSLSGRLFQDFRFNYTPDWTFSKFQNFLRRGSPSPFPIPLPRSFSGFALDSGFALKSRTLRAIDSGFARFRPPNFWPVVAPVQLTLDKMLEMPCMDTHESSLVNYIYTLMERGHIPSSNPTPGFRKRPKFVYRFLISRCWQVWGWVGQIKLGNDRMPNLP